jgi:general secretion pathway protein A
VAGLAMFDPWFGFRRRPFSETADPDVFYPSPGYEHACTELFAAIRTCTGLVVLTGEPGSGKTTVLRRVVRDAEADGSRVLSCSVTAPLDAMCVPLARQLGAPDSVTRSGPPREAVLAALQARAPEGSAIVIALDEAQLLAQAELEDLHALTEARAATGARLAVLLAGQPELELTLAKLSDHKGGAAGVFHVSLPRLPASDVGAYVAYRLGQAGGRRDVFLADAIERIAVHAEGIPRVINQLCDAALRTARESGLATVSAAIVDVEARRLELPSALRATSPPAQRTPRGGAGPKARQPADAVSVKPHSGSAIRRATLVLVVASVVILHSSHGPWQLPQVSLPRPVQVAALRLPVESDLDALTPAVTTPPTKPASPASASVAKWPAESGRKSVAISPPRRRAPEKPVPQSSDGSTGSRVAPALLDNAEVGNLTVVQALLAAGVSPDARDISSMTPLMVAVIHDRGAIAELLLARGADVNAVDDGGVTALMLAANNGRTALLQRLLDRGARVNAKSQAGWTALTYAPWSGHPEVGRRLLAAGADPFLRDRSGWIPLQYAAWRAADSIRPPASGLQDSPMDTESTHAANRRYTELVDLLSSVGRSW